MSAGTCKGCSISECRTSSFLDVDLACSRRMFSRASKTGNYKCYKRRGIGQYPIFSRTPYFSGEKHTTVVLKVEALGQKGSFSLSSMQPIKDTNPKKLNIQILSMTHMYCQETPKIPSLNMPSRHIWVTYAQCQACLLYTSPSPRDGLLSRMPSSA